MSLKCWGFNEKLLVFFLCNRYIEIDTWWLVALCFLLYSNPRSNHECFRELNDIIVKNQIQGFFYPSYSELILSLWFRVFFMVHDSFIKNFEYFEDEK